ncbi:MAG: class I SAM-dependent methyltransferase [Pseudomonadota bacterium]
MANKAAVWDKMADKYSRQPIANQKAYEIKLDLSREYFTPESEVLEFGCGTGSTALLHAPYVKHIDATDVSSEMIRIAKEKRDAQGIDNVNFAVADMDDYAVEPQRYDAILGLNILHLLDDRHKVMRNVVKALKPGGHFISSTMCLREKLLFTLMDPLFPIMHGIGKWPRVQRFNVERLRQDIEASGLETVHTWQPGKGPVLFHVGRKPA